MIEFHNVTKEYRLKGARKTIVSNLTMRFPSDRNIGLIGRNGAGKSTLLNMVGGILRPDSGEIVRLGRVSWPMGFSGGFHAQLTGRQNARFVARIYGANTEEMETFVEDFSELGKFLDMPVRTYSSGMRARLAFGVSLAAEFDCYLVDEITGVGDARFKRKCRVAFRERMGRAQVIMVSHSDATLRAFCDSAVVLENGIATYFHDIDEGLAVYNETIAA